LQALPAYQDHADWLPLALANAVMLVSLVFGWVFANGPAHGELMAGFVTMAAVGFAVHSIVESMHLDQSPGAATWSEADRGLREVDGGTRRAGAAR
jgi:hypothetical protein